MLEATKHPPSRLNGENIAGAAFLFFSFLLMLGGQMNAVLGLLYPAYYILVAAGTGLVVLGYRTYRSEQKRSSRNGSYY